MFAYPAVRPRVALLLALAVAGLIGPAAAQQPSATAIATAKELIKAKGADSMYKPLVSGVIEQAKVVFLRTNPMLSKDLNEVAAKLHADYAGRGVEVENDFARVYASRFSEQELKDALAFYRTPLGKKLITEEPAILDQSMKNAQNWANKLSEEIVVKMRAEMRKRGHDI